MDIIIPIVILILLFITCSVCGYCCKRNKQGVVYGIAAPPVTTTTTTTNYQATPYPVMDTPMPQPGAVTAPVGFAPHAAYPPTTPYPPAHGIAPYPTSVPYGYHPMPMPMMGGFPGAAPYPAMAAMPMPGGYTSPAPAYPANSAATQLPPSYAEATQMAQSSTTNEGYVKQAPYNPHYN